MPQSPAQCLALPILLGDQIGASSPQQIDGLAHPLSVFDRQPPTLQETVLIEPLQPVIGRVAARKEEPLHLIRSKGSVFVNRQHNMDIALGQPHPWWVSYSLVTGQRPPLFRHATVYHLAAGRNGHPSVEASGCSPGRRKGVRGNSAGPPSAAPQSGAGRCHSVARLRWPSCMDLRRWFSLDKQSERRRLPLLGRDAKRPERSPEVRSTVGHGAHGVAPVCAAKKR